MSPFVAAFGVVVSLQSAVMVDRPGADQSRPVRLSTERPSAAASRATWPITLGDTLDVRSWGQAPAATAAPQVRSRITVAVPQDDTELLVDDAATKTTGKSREFETPPLEPGKLYRYTLTARWAPNNYTVITRSKTVEFKAGDEVIVDLTQEGPNDRAKIRFIPTPEDIAREMVALAGVTKDDVVYEPGCGDARITVAAVKAGAKRGVGIDIDPERVAEARANVKAAGLEDQIEIRLGDALDIKDLPNATVVFLYMGDEFDLLIRPILWKQLRVGARVVSHRFMMGDWKPDRTVSVNEEYESSDIFNVHLWTITEEIKRRVGD